MVRFLVDLELYCKNRMELCELEGTWIVAAACLQVIDPR